MTPEHAYLSFVHSIDENRIAQAVVVVGPPRGTGDAFARRVLSRLLCREADSPCGVCTRCRSVEKGCHPDVHRLEPQKKSRIISIDQMRAFLHNINTTSFEGGWKGGVIVSADCLNASSANAFLKTLEEPPEKTVFFLLTDSPQRLLPTIVSRCQRISIDDHSAGVASEEDCRLLIDILSSGGAVGGTLGAFGRADRITSLLKKRKAEIEKEEKSISRDDSDEDIDKDTLDARIGARYREWRQGILCALLQWYRDIFILVCGGEETYIFFQEDLESLKSAANRCSYRQALAQIRAIETAVVQLNRNLSESLIFENVFFNVAENES